MSRSILEEKRELRARLRLRLKTIPTAQREEAGIRAGAILKEQTIWQNASSVLFYAALDDEINLGALLMEALDEGKTVALPRFVSEEMGYGACRVAHAGELVSGRFGILEPCQDSPIHPLKRLDLVLVPGVGFDASGRRLGRGKGYYDRLLAEIRGIKVGVGFEEQIEPELPAEPHDRRVDFILTPARWLRVAQQ